MLPQPPRHDPGRVQSCSITDREEAFMASYSGDKDAYLKRLRRIEGQVRGLQRMVEEDQYCIDILTQVSAATKALQAFSLELLGEHLATCVVQAAAAGGRAAEDKVREASDAIARLVRS
jgi:CsoR family transcriptional regulator, copper-sensing transcriptional repressor